MKILIITTYFPPDTAVAAVRPYMFSKYLTQLGHDVTVLRSGEILDGVSDFFEQLPIKVISYLGGDSPSERYERGERYDNERFSRNSRMSFLPFFLRFPLSKIYHGLNRRKYFDSKLRKAEIKAEKLCRELDKMCDAGFQVVFSTYGELENIYGGYYAAQLFNCPLIQDFRDPLANRELGTRREYRILKKIQDEAVRNASACTAVSEGVLSEVCQGETPGFVLYNGYDAVAETSLKEQSAMGDVLSFCYTGQLYAGKQDFSPLLRALRTLADKGEIPLDKLCIHYAGKDFEYLLAEAKKYRVDAILKDHGYVDRKQAAQIQKQSDIFLVLSWNTKKARGVLTGKFYEGIRAHKPILAVVAGEVPHSELDLINQKYRYGFCYEVSREKEQFNSLCDYLEKAYCKKMSAGVVEYAPEPALEEDFRYDILSERLENICLQLIREKK